MMTDVLNFEENQLKVKRTGVLIIYLNSRAPAFLAVYLHFPIMGFDKVFYDSKAETGASKLP